MDKILVQRAQEKLAFEICESLCENMEAGENETRRLAAKVCASKRVTAAIAAITEDNLKDEMLPDGRNRHAQEMNLIRSQLANCQKEIQRLRDALISTGRSEDVH